MSRADDITRLEDIPNVGPATAADLRLLGFSLPAQIKGADPYQLYTRLCAATHARQDPCVLDVFISIVRLLDGAPARPWWAYTTERKRDYPDL